MRKYSLLLAGLPSFASGCVIHQGMTDVPVITQMPPRAVVSLADVVNNIKCDVQVFIKDNHLLTATGRDFGGTLTFTLDKSNSSEVGLKVGIPIATGIKIDANADRSNSVAYGETVTTPFVIHFDEHASLANCGSLRVVETNGVVTPMQLDKPILNLGALREQLQAVLPGEPRITFGDFQFSGSIAFTRATAYGGGVNVVIINPSASDKISADYKIDYKIGTNWSDIIKDAKFTMDDPSTIATATEMIADSEPAEKPKATKPKGQANKKRKPATHPRVPPG